jgi:hypothetical protein
MDKKLPIGISDFQKLITKECIIVDKTLLIKDIIDNSSEVILITRPRRFGKTLNLSMLYYFLQNNQPVTQNIFKNLLISQEIEFCAKHQNKYPVIFISFKDIKYNNFADAYNSFAALFSDLFSNHMDLLVGELLYKHEKKLFLSIVNKSANNVDLARALANLSRYLERKFKQNPIILIDEYDTPIQEAYLRGYYQKLVDFMRIIMGGGLKDNEHLNKAVITGITRIAQESLFSGVNNLEVYSLLREDYGQYFGFSETEVMKLIAKTQEDVSLKDIKEWYNGYQVGGHVLYNPWSILNCLKQRGKLEPYWVNTASNDLIYKLLSNSDELVKQKFEALLQGEIIEQAISTNLIFPEIENNPEALWSLLLHAGYLKVLSSKLQDHRFMAQIAIPNKEVSFVYDQIIEKWFSKAISLQSYDKFIQSLMSNDIIKFKHYLTTYIMQTGSYFDFNSNTPEQIFHVFVLGLVVGLREHYAIHSNQEAGFGRFDVIFMPKNNKSNGILLEFKTAKTSKQLVAKAKEALAQIKDKNYLESFKQHGVESVLAMGLAFCGKQLELAYEQITL